MSLTRRDFLKTLSGVALGALPPNAHPDHARAGPASAQSDWCGGGDRSQPLFIPGERGFLGRLVPDDETLTLRAAVLAPADDAPAGLSQAYLASFRGREYVNPTLVLHPGQRVRVELVNAISEPTIVHWHGLAVDTRNDGAGTALAAPGERYAYSFEVRNRGALYWYHPHPHGLTAGQAYRGMFGLLEIADAEEEKLRAALDLRPGKTEIPLVLQDRRTGRDYAAGDADRLHGFLGDSAKSAL